MDIKDNVIQIQVSVSVVVCVCVCVAAVVVGAHDICISSSPAALVLAGPHLYVHTE